MLPPVVVGLFVFLLLSRQGPLGSLSLLYSPTAMIVAEFFIAAPVIAAITMGGVASVPREVRLQALGLGASRWQTTWLVIREARVTILSAIVAGFGAAISEVGAVMMVGGNLSVNGHNMTGTMTTATMALVRQGDYAMAMAFGLILLLLAFIITFLLTRTQQGIRRRWLQS
jgi:tungstate transport system permease protein